MPLKSINTNSSIPVYIQIENMVRFAIASGELKGQLEVGQHVHWDTSGENVVFGPLDGLGIVVAVRKSAFYPVSASREYDIKLAQGGVLTGVHESAIPVPDKKDAMQHTVWVSSDTHYEEILLLDYEEQAEILRHKIKELERGNTAVVNTKFPDAALSEFKCMLRAREAYLEEHTE